MTLSAFLPSNLMKLLKMLDLQVQPIDFQVKKTDESFKISQFSMENRRFFKIFVMLITDASIFILI